MVVAQNTTKKKEDVRKKAGGSVIRSQLSCAGGREGGETIQSQKRGLTGAPVRAVPNS